jgi:chromosomal replication initiation ATPase DnaA
MTRYYIDLKEYAKTADINEVSDETLKEVIKDFLLEAQNRALSIHDVVKSFTAEQVVNELEECDTLDDAIMFFKENK